MRDKKLDRLFLRFRDRGDVRALSRVFDITSRELLEVAAHVTRDASQAEDLLQTTFLIAIERAQHYDGSRRLMPWLVGILTREAMRWNRDAARRIELDRVATREEVQPSIELESRELSTALLQAIDKLPSLYRDVLVRHLREEKSAGEIARELDRSPGTVRVQIHRALELLRSSLPAGIALGGIGVIAPRGLAAVRGAVVREATRAAREWATSQVALTAVTSVVGGIIVKKLALAVAVVLVLAGAWWTSARHSVVDSSPKPLRLAALDSQRVNAADVSDSLASEPSNERRAVQAIATDERAAASDATLPGSLLVCVKWKDDGSPAAEIHIGVTPDRERWQTRREIESVSGADGIARISALAPGTYDVEIDRSDVGGRIEVKSNAESRLDCAIPAGVDVDGVVVDGGGAPVENAGIWLSSLHSLTGGRIVTHSASDGAFHLRAVDHNQWLSARAARFAPSDLEMLNDPRHFGKRATVRLELGEPGQTLRGIVRDASGTPLGGARVSAGSGLESEYLAESGGIAMKLRKCADGSWRARSEPLQALTDDHGRFEIEGIETGDVPVVIWGQSSSPWSGHVHVDADAPAELDVRLPQSVVLSGTITKLDGTAAANVYVVAMARTLLLESSATTDSSGSYRIESVPIGEIEVRANQQRLGALSSATSKLEVRPGEHLLWNAVLSGNALIIGHLINEKGAPLRAWAGIARRGHGVLHELYAATDANGRFKFEGCDDGIYTLEFHPAGNSEAFPSVWRTGVRAGSAEIEMNVSAQTRAAAHLRGRLVDANGSVVTSAKLRLVFSVLNDWRESALERADGRFDLGPLPPGDYVLAVITPSMPEYRELVRCELAPGQTNDAGDVVLE